MSEKPKPNPDDEIADRLMALLDVATSLAREGKWDEVEMVTKQAVDETKNFSSQKDKA